MSTSLSAKVLKTRTIHVYEIVFSKISPGISDNVFSNSFLNCQSETSPCEVRYVYAREGKKREKMSDINLGLCFMCISGWLTKGSVAKGGGFLRAVCRVSVIDCSNISFVLYHKSS